MKKSLLNGYIWEMQKKRIKRQVQMGEMVMERMEGLETEKENRKGKKRE